MRTALQSAVLAVLLTVGCSSSHSGTDDAGSDPTIDAGPDPRIDGGPVPDDAGPPPWGPPPGAIVCGGGVCAAGEECCLLTGSCVAIGDPACAIPDDAPWSDACVRGSDCGPGEVCEVPDESGSWTIGLCAGVLGRCMPARPPAECGGFGAGVCGCDGRTYPDPCAASRAGTRVSVFMPCGIDVHSSYHQSCETDEHCTLALGPSSRCDPAIGECVREDAFVACGVDEQCAPGDECCPITGTCYDPSRPERCAVPPEGTYFPCSDDVDCWRQDGSFWSHPGSRHESFCAGPGCGPVGGCMRIPSECAGVLAPVCGCDGTSYQNECEANRQGVRVAHGGPC